MPVNKTASKNNIFFYIITASFIFLSVFFLIVLLRISTPKPPVQQKKVELISRIKEAEKQRNELRMQIERLQKNLDELERRSSRTDSEIRALKERLDAMRKEAGLTEIKGPGLEIVLEDAETADESTFDEQKIVHDSDIRLVVNALFLGGAKAVSVNGERITPVTSIRCVGPTVLVNNRRVTSPFRITAIGDPDELEAGLLKEPQISRYLYELFPSLGIKVNLTRKNSLRVPPYRGSLPVDLDGVKVVQR
jgi:uncharacterized protein YlxW (UPF0749 family)